MLKLDVPFVPDRDYVDFLADQTDCLASVHFSLHHADLPDARQRLHHTSTDEIVTGLKQLGAVPKYVLMNSRLHAPNGYFDAARLDRVAHSLDFVRHEAGLDGVIFADPYFLQALSDAHPNRAEQLEAVPSINCMLDSAEKTFAMLHMIAGTAFKPPSRIIADRSLNRDPARLATLSKQLKKNSPDLKIHLMANEGCLYQCPYKPAHDAHMAMVNEGLAGDRTFATNHDFGCVKRLLAEPGLMLASPFIRPEDADRYAAHIDGIKLCGRTKGTAFLKRAVTAWKRGAYAGNLLDLMDAMGDLADRVVIPNALLDHDFFERVTSCDKNCPACGWCAAMFQRIGQAVEPGLARL